MAIADIQAQIDQLQFELNQENQRGALKDAAKVEDLEKRISDLSQELDAEKRVVQFEQSKDDAAAQVATLIESLDWEGVPPKEIFLNYSEDSAAEAYQYFSAVVQNAFAASKQADLLRIKELEDKLELSNESIVVLQERIEDAAKASAELEREYSELELKLKDAEAKRNAAATQLEDANKEIERLNGHVDDLRKQIAVGASAAVQVIDVEAARAKYLEQRRKEEQSKPAIYDVQPLDAKRSRFTAKFADTDQPIEFSYLEAGKYREVTAEVADTFRAEYLAKQAEDAQTERDHADSTRVMDMEEQPVTAAQFQTEEDSNSTTGGVDQTDASSAVAGAPVTREEFDALKARVAAIEESKSNGTLVA